MTSLRSGLVKMAKALTKKTGGDKHPFTVIVEGNIGSGKTTFLNYFEKFHNISVCSEPVELWRDCAGHNLLQYLYQDPKKWGFTFQSYVLQTMIDQHTRVMERPIKMMERSIFSARYCFTEKMFRDGNLPEPSKAVLDAWFGWLLDNADLHVDLIIYLRTSPEVVYERTLKRNRDEERSLPLEYLADLHRFHEDWLYHKTIFECPAPVLTVNANLDKSVIGVEYEKCKTTILQELSADVCL